MQTDISLWYVQRVGFISTLIRVSNHGHCDGVLSQLSSNPLGMIKVRSLACLNSKLCSHVYYLEQLNFNHFDLHYSRWHLIKLWPAFADSSAHNLVPLIVFPSLCDCVADGCFLLLESGPFLYVQMLTLYTPHSSFRISTDQFWPLNGAFSNIWFQQVRICADLCTSVCMRVASTCYHRNSWNLPDVNCLVVHCPENRLQRTVSPDVTRS